MNHDHRDLLNHVALQVDFSAALAAAAQVGAAVAGVMAVLLGVQLVLHVLSDGAISPFLGPAAFEGAGGDDVVRGEGVGFDATRTERNFKRIETAPRGASRSIYREGRRFQREKRRRDVESIGYDPRAGFNVLSMDWAVDGERPRKSPLPRGY